MLQGVQGLVAGISRESHLCNKRFALHYDDGSQLYIPFPRCLRRFMDKQFPYNHLTPFWRLRRCREAAEKLVRRSEKVGASSSVKVPPVFPSWRQAHSGRTWRLDDAGGQGNTPLPRPLARPWNRTFRGQPNLLSHSWCHTNGARCRRQATAGCHVKLGRDSGGLLRSATWAFAVTNRSGACFLPGVPKESTNSSPP